MFVSFSIIHDLRANVILSKVTNNRLGWKCVQVTKPLAYFWLFLTAFLSIFYDLVGKLERLYFLLCRLALFKCFSCFFYKQNIKQLPYSLHRHNCDQGILKGGSITVPLTSCLTGLESAVWQLTIFVFICKTDHFKPVKQEVNSTVILPTIKYSLMLLSKFFIQHLTSIMILCLSLFFFWISFRQTSLPQQRPPFYRLRYQIESETATDNDQLTSQGPILQNIFAPNLRGRLTSWRICHHLTLIKDLHCLFEREEGCGTFQI